MGRREFWTNEDGLVVGFGNRETENYRPGVVSDGDLLRTVVVDFDFSNLPQAREGDTGIVHLVPGSRLIEGRFYVEDAFDAIVNVGFTEDDGTAIDADGFGSFAIADTTAGATLAADGDLVGEVVSATDNAYIAVDTDSTAGSGRLEVTYALPIETV